MARDLVPGAVVLVSGVAYILLADVVLMSKDLLPVTASLKTRSGKLFLIALGGHVLDIWGPCDPFRTLGALAGVYKRRKT